MLTSFWSLSVNSAVMRRFHATVHPRSIKDPGLPAATSCRANPKWQAQMALQPATTVAGGPVPMTTRQFRPWSSSLLTTSLSIDGGRRVAATPVLPVITSRSPRMRTIGGTSWRRMTWMMIMCLLLGKPPSQETLSMLVWKLMSLNFLWMVCWTRARSVWTSSGRGRLLLFSAGCVGGLSDAGQTTVLWSLFLLRRNMKERSKCSGVKKISWQRWDLSVVQVE